MTGAFPASERRLQRRTLRDVTPFEAADEGDGVPVSLSEALFGPVAGAGEAGLFVLLDAGRVPALVERLEQSDQPAVCLFQGEAAENLADAAPWLVELRPGDKILRDLMTRDRDDPWALWDANAGIFLRAQVPLADLRRHLRRFTRQQDRTGKWFYVRFYDPAIMIPYLVAMSDEKRRTFLGPILRIMGVTDGTARMIEVVPDGAG